MTPVEKRYYYPSLTGLPDAPEWRDSVAPVSGSASSLLADALLPLLDGTHSLEEIYGTLLAQGYAWDAVPRALQWLDDQGLLQEAPHSAAAALTDEEKQRYGAQINAFAQLIEPRRTATSPDDSMAGWSEQARLKQSVVIQFGLGQAGRTLASALMQCGVGRIIAAPAPDFSDATAADALQTELRRAHPDSNFLAVTAPEDLPEQLGEVTSDLMLYCPDRFDEAFCFWLNSVALEIKVPLLLYRRRVLEIDLGPLIIPHETACAVCLERRSTAAQAISEQRPAGDPSEAAFQMPLGLDLLALDILKFLSHAAEPVTRSRLWRLNLATGMTELHSILKLPRCPACGVHKTRPPRKLWEELQ